MRMYVTFRSFNYLVHIAEEEVGSKAKGFKADNAEPAHLSRTRIQINFKKCRQHLVASAIKSLNYK